jgi:hypothetical protein
MAYTTIFDTVFMHSSFAIDIPRKQLHAIHATSNNIFYWAKLGISGTTLTLSFVNL